MYNPFAKKIQKTEQDIFIDKLPVHPDLKKTVKTAFNRFVTDDYDGNEGQKRTDLQIIRDASEVGLMDLTERNTKAFNLLNSPGNAAGYQPGGSVLRKIYPREFALHSFLAEAYWAAAKSRKELWVDTHRDDYVLAASDSVSKKTIKLINGVLEDLNVRYYRNLLRDIVLVNGNAVIANKRNKFGGLIEINPLLMERVDPHYNTTNSILEGWDYYWDNSRPVFLPYDSVDHIKTYSARSMVLGQPALTSVVTDIEAALQASIYNNNVMQKGGLLSVVFRLKNPDGSNGQIISDKVSLNLADEFTKWLERRFGGIRGSGQIAFIPMVEGVDVLNKIGEMDNAWSNLDDKVAIKSCGLLGLFPERIGIMRTSQYQNKQTVDDSMSLSMDNNNYYVQDLVDEYLTRVIIKEGLGIDNVKIQASGEFSATTKTSAEVGKIISEMGADVMSVDEFRVKVMHLEPLGGELGAKFLGQVTREAAMQKANNSGSNLTKAVGKLNHTFLANYAESSHVLHRRKYISFY